ncbi:hypothetical protein K2173_018316 [Erythroxylum novogranatense]|uniref:X-ray induced transcript 1 n=1 Tax=Erythroxylum novogranatense TaxID=1862640 RepID=A0AAV8UDG1_9ROSI|nr:hypothetical protein K2173_018316 [Erythroxylum novogranatense]
MDDTEYWGWQRDGFSPQKDCNFDASESLWNQVTLNEDDLCNIFDETTPVKACGDLTYHGNYNDNMNKEPEERRETSSQLKRRRMLHFDTQETDSILCNEEMKSAFFKSNGREHLIDDVMPQALPCVPGFPDVSAGCYESLDQSPEGWVAECFNDTDMHLSPDDMNVPGASDIQIDISEFCNDLPEFEANLVQKQVIRTPPNIIVKGKKSLLQTPTKLAASVVYPFAFIKPCGMQGDITLNDINQRIRTPPPSKSKQIDDDPAAYPTSAFSGKPVVGKTKIRTEGGKGSITIMRTKG